MLNQRVEMLNNPGENPGCASVANNNGTNNLRNRFLRGVAMCQCISVAADLGRFDSLYHCLECCWIAVAATNIFQQQLPVVLSRRSFTWMGGSFMPVRMERRAKCPS